MTKSPIMRWSFSGNGKIIKKVGEADLAKYASLKVFKTSKH